MPERDYLLDDRDGPRIVVTLRSLAAMLTAPVGDAVRLTDAQVQALSHREHIGPRDREAAAANLQRAAEAIEAQMTPAAKGRPYAMRMALTGGVRLLAATGMLAAGQLGSPGGATQASPTKAAIAAQCQPAVRPRRDDHPEQPHVPEMEAAELPGQETEVLERHVLVLDDPKYGVLNGLNYLGYCDTCPLVGQLCYGPCPGYDQPGGYAGAQTPPAD